MKNDFGPFTPQELEPFVDWLKAKDYSFEISKDENIEKEFTINNGENAVFRADLRTKIYLAQIFTVSVDNLSAAQISEIQTTFKLSEEIPERFQNSGKVIQFESEPELKNRLNKKIMQKRIWATIFFVAIVVPILITFYKILQN